MHRLLYRQCIGAASLAQLGGIRVLAYVHRLLYRQSSLNRLHMCARIGVASLAQLGGIRVLPYVYRLLYRQSSFYRLLGLKSCKKQPSYSVLPSYVHSHRCGLACYARSAGRGIRVLAYVHRLLYRQSSFYRLLGHKICIKKGKKIQKNFLSPYTKIIFRT